MGKTTKDKSATNKAGIRIDIIKKFNEVKLNDDIMRSIKGSKEMKKIITDTFQKVNRRIENIEKAGIASPAYESIKFSIPVKNRNVYTKFSAGNFNINSEESWEMLKQRYTLAVSFLNQPTSTARGAGQYVKHLKDTIGGNITTEQINNIIVQSVYDTQMGGRGGSMLAKNFYRSITDKFLVDSKNVGKEMINNSKDNAKLLENNIKEVASEMSKEFNKMNKKYTESFTIDSQKIK